MTRVVAVDPDRPDPLILDQAAAIIRSGGLVAFGTETVYGLGADATDPAAVARIFAAKGRPPTNPLIVHVADEDEVHDLVAVWRSPAGRLAKHFWPGPLTLILPRLPSIPDIVTAGQGTVGVRVPASLVARELIRRAGVPVAAPSANRSNRISPTTAAHVLKDLDGAVDLILDSGPCTVGIESTVLDISGDVPTILRPGEVTEDQIAAIIMRPVAHFTGSVGDGQVAFSPGQLAFHYAPKTPAYRLDPGSVATFDPPAGTRWGVVTLGEIPDRFDPARRGPDILRWAANYLLGSPRVAAAKIYDALHRLDALGVDFLVIVTPADDAPGWEAVLDRVRRATRPWDGRGPGG